MTFLIDRADEQSETDSRRWKCGAGGCHYGGRHPGGRTCPDCGSYSTMYLSKRSRGTVTA